MSHPPSSLVASSHLFKELTSTSSAKMTVSNSTTSAEGSAPNAASENSSEVTPPCKKLKLDIEAANNFVGTKSMRQRLLEKRIARRKRVMESYKDNMSELFFLQSKGNVVDLPAFRKRPSQQYMNFLKSNNAPQDVLDEVKLAVLGPNAVFEKPNSGITVSTSASGKVTVTSAAMAAAVVANPNWKPVTTEATSSGSTHPAKAPYSPRSNILSPVKFGDQLKPYNRGSTATSTTPSTSTMAITPGTSATSLSTPTSSYAAYRLPTYSKELLMEKIRQEAWVNRRINDLCREGLWSEKRLPKVCERPKPRTHWDAVLSEVQWLAVDFHEERKWKMAAAKMLAYSAKVYVEQQADRKARKAAALEKSHRKIAKFMATQVELFWNSISTIIHSDTRTINSHQRSSNDHANNSRTANHVGELYHGEASSESGVGNLDYEEEEEELFENDSDLDDFDLAQADHVQDLDDESTIEEQEEFEAKNNVDLQKVEQNELSVLEGDNAKPLEEVLAMAFPNYDLNHSVTSNLTEVQHDSSISSEEESDDDDDDSDVDVAEDDVASDGFDFSDSEWIINLPLSSGQRKLYDDYLSSASSRKALDSLDAESIAKVLHSLRKICNHPQLLAEEVPDQNDDEKKNNEIVFFPRVADDLMLPKIVANRYDPMKDIDLASLNLVFFTHESTLTAITSDRLRKCCAPKALIEELPMTSSGASETFSKDSIINVPPRVPVYPVQSLFQTAEGRWQMEVNSKTSSHGTAEISSSHGTENAFHPESLNVIAKFNERRCQGMPLYGQDLIEVLTIVSPEASCSQPKMASKTWKGSGYLNPTALASTTSELLPNDRLAAPFWPFFGTKKPRSSKHLRDRCIRSTATSGALSSVSAIQIHSDLLLLTQGLSLPPKVQVVAGLHRNPLISNHLAVVEAVKFARAKARQGCYPGSSISWIQTSAMKQDFRNASSKMSKLDALLQEFRKNSERALVFCEMPEMLLLLRRYLHSHHYPFVYLDPNANVKERLSVVEDFSHRSHFNLLLTSPRAANTLTNGPNNILCGRFNGLTNICNVVFFDSNLNNSDNHLDTLEWCRSFNGLTQLNVHKLVCEDTVEDSLSIKALQQKLMLNNSETSKMEITTSSHNGPVWKIKKHALEALFNPKFGDNGVMTSGNNGKDKNVKKTTIEDILEDPEAIAQLDWLWTNKIRNNLDGGRNLVELSQQVDKGCLKDDRKPIFRKAQKILPTLMIDQEDFHKSGLEDLEAAKLEWEEAFQKELALLASELEAMDRLEPPLTYSRDDASRSWHGLDGQPMALWTPPMPIPNAQMGPEVKTGLRVDEHLSYLYEMTLMEETALPPVYIKKELKRTAAEAQLDKHKMRKEAEGYPSTPGGSYVPPTLFDCRYPMATKTKKRPPMGGPGYPSGHPAGPNAGTAPTGLPRYPIPRQQVEAENQPEWLIQEDWALLNTIKEIQGLPLTLNTVSRAHTVNWDLVSDMVNAVSRVYRGPRQCKYRFDNIIAPREEGRILYDMPGGTTAATLAASVAAAANNKKSKKKQLGANMKLGHSGGPAKMNRPMKTSQIFNQDKNTSWSALFATRFETIKAVANKRSPTTKPMVVNQQQKSTKHAGVLGEYGISYEAPLNPIQVAANRAERIQKEKQKSQAEQVAQMNQQRLAAAQAAANNAQQSAAATARVAIVQQQNQPGGNQQAVVVGIPQSAGGATQQVRQVITHPAMQELVRTQAQSAQAVSLAQQQQGSTVVVTSHPPVVSVGGGNLTPNQLAQTLVAQKAQVVSKAGAGATAGGSGSTVTAQRQLTPAQINILKQQAMLKGKTAAEKARLQGIQPGTTVVAATTNTGQKVSIAVTPTGGVTLASIASNSMPITVVTQQGQQKTQLIRGVTTSGGTKNIRMTENEMKLLLAKQQQLQQQQQGQGGQGQGGQAQGQQKGQTAGSAVTQLIQGIQGGQSVTTLVKPATSSQGAVSQSVTIPVQMQNVQGIKTLRPGAGGQQQTMVQLRHQLVQPGGPRSKIIPQAGQTILTSQGQKVALSQVGGKGLPAQLIVSSGNSQKPVTVQQIQQIKGQGGQGTTGIQQLIPHAVLAKGQGQGSAVQARVIPATVAGRPQQIHVVAAPASSAAQAALTARQAAAPNVTVDASGRPTSGTNNVQLGSQIRVAAGSQQLLNQVLSVRSASGNVISQAPTSTTSTTTTKLHVVHPSQQGQQDQNNG